MMPPLHFSSNQIMVDILRLIMISRLQDESSVITLRKYQFKISCWLYNIFFTTNYFLSNRAGRYNEDSEDPKTVIREEKFLDEDKKPCRRLTIITSNERHGYYQEQDDQGNWRMFGRYSRGEIFSNII